MIPPRIKEVQALAIEIVNEDSTLKEEKNKKLKEMVEEKFTTKEEIII